MQLRHVLPKLALVLSVLAASVTACNLATTKPTVIISAPPSGSQFRDGEEIAIQSTSTDSAGVTLVELIVDGAVVRTDPSPNPQVSFTLIQTWKATPGAHTIHIRAYNTAKAVSEPAAISITVAQGIAGAPTVTPGAPPATVPAPAVASPTPVGACANNAAFVTDVSIPDGATLAAGQTFNKIWRLKNTGTCPWGAGYQFVFVANEAMTTNTAITVPATAPGDSVDVAVPMTAPTAPGSHTGLWQLRAPGGGFFGTRVSVKITVPGAPGCVGTPNIASFTASAATVAPGAAVTLSWGAVTGAESAEIDQGVGGVETPGSRVVNPTTTTTYTMTAKCGANTKTARVTITVASSTPTPSACSGTPNIAAFTASTSAITLGAAATLSWGAVTNADAVEIDQGIGGVATPGSTSVTPATTTTYTLTAKCGAASATRQVTITVNPVTSNFAGQWITNFGTLNITQSGSTATGTYLNAFDGGSGTVAGVVTGSTLTGTYQKATSGTIQFTLGASGNTFDGNWAGTGLGTNKWCGARPGVAFPAGCSFAGAWNIKVDSNTCATMNLTRIDNTVTGTYCDGVLTGAVTYSGAANESVLTGTWTRGGTGALKFYLLDYGGLQFQGDWNTTNKWCGWRSGSAEPATCLR